MLLQFFFCSCEYWVYARSIKVYLTFHEGHIILGIAVVDVVDVVFVVVIVNVAVNVVVMASLVLEVLVWSCCCWVGVLQ